MYVVIWGTAFFYFLSIYIVSLFPQTEIFRAMDELYPDPIFWLVIILITVAAMLPVVVSKYVRFNYHPMMYQTM
jgi:hypothetical protein